MAGASPLPLELWISKYLQRCHGQVVFAGTCLCARLVEKFGDALNEWLAQRPDRRLRFLLDPPDVLFRKLHTEPGTPAPTSEGFCSALQSRHPHLELRLSPLPLPFEYVLTERDCFQFFAFSDLLIECPATLRLPPERGFPPEEEWLPWLDEAGNPVGCAPRSRIEEEGWKTLVVWGWVFDPRGRLLLHRRSARARDNRRLWDKSFGGHVQWSETLNPRRTALRELHEEILRPSPHPPRFLGSFSGFQHAHLTLPGHAFLHLHTLPDYTSRRRLPDGSLHPKRARVDMFAFLLDDDAPLRRQSEEMEETRWVELDSLPREVEKNQEIFTFDLRWMTQNPAFQLLQEFRNLILKKS